MYDGLERELVMSAEEERLRPCLEAGVTPFDAGDFQDSILALRQCLGLPEARRWIAMAELRTTGRSRLTADLESVWGPCVQGGVEELYGGSAEVAVDLLRRCDELDESLRWLGLALARSGRMDEAALALEQSTELLPRNRCRPSFNALLRRLAGEDPNVILVDLDATARAASAPLLPGRDLFVDSCHMNWRGYGLMAAQVLRKVGEAGAGILPLVPVPTEAEILVWGEGRGLPAPEVGP
jgi:tetratricopeptide (TPR) repeat protein